MRLQKFLAQSGFGARRKCEDLIAAGRVTINGQVATLGAQVEPGDDVRVNGQPVRAPEAKVYIAVHKPVGYASDLSDPHAKTVFDLVKAPQRLYAVGRLDKDSSGLMLLTNDGAFAHHLTHPKFEHEKEYHVVVTGHPSQPTLRRWREGVLLDGEDTKTVPARVRVTEARRVGTQNLASLQIVMHEGRKRQIRRIAKLLGHPVIELQRTRVGSVRLGALKSGEWRKLSTQEVHALLEGKDAPAS